MRIYAVRTRVVAGSCLLGLVSLGLVTAGTSSNLVAGASRGLNSSQPAGVSACPPPPQPPGAVAPTSLSQEAAPSGPTVTVSSGSSTSTLGPGVCQWVYHYPSQAGDPIVTSTYLGTEHMTLSTSYAVNYSSYYGVSCDLHAEVLNGFGGGGAQQTLNSSHCNTDGYVPGESSVQVVGSGASGPVQTVATFNSTVTSFVSGYSVYYGIFDACSENPVGQTSTYSCDYFYGGPLF